MHAGSVFKTTCGITQIHFTAALKNHSAMHFFIKSIRKPCSRLQFLGQLLGQPVNFSLPCCATACVLQMTPVYFRYLLDSPKRSSVCLQHYVTASCGMAPVTGSAMDF